MWLCKRDLSKECKGDYKDCTDCILDKIRAEIEEVELNITYKENHKVGGTWGLRKALEIINKYRGEV